MPWRLLPLPPLTIVRRSAERSAARLAHQSGGLGVPSSNLGAPTNKIKDLQRKSTLDASQKSALGSAWETERKKSASDHNHFRTRSGILDSPAVPLALDSN